MLSARLVLFSNADGRGLPRSRAMICPSPPRRRAARPTEARWAGCSPLALQLHGERGYTLAGGRPRGAHTPALRPAIATPGLAAILGDSRVWSATLTSQASQPPAAPRKGARRRFLPSVLASGHSTEAENHVRRGGSAVGAGLRTAAPSARRAACS